MKRVGFAANTAGAMLAASGIGALLSPPTLGAAAFLIAEYPSGSVPASARDGDDPDHPLLLVDPSHD